MYRMLKRLLGLYYNYFRYKLLYRGKVVFNGFSVVYQFPKSEIKFLYKQDYKICINSSALSNLVGLYQRTIIVARYGGSITIGAGCGISGSTIYAMNNIEIGERVLIGGNCKIIDNDFHPLHENKRISQHYKDIKSKPIKIGDGCFIGANSIILKGTTLGRNVVVGAGSVVHGTFPENVIIAGNPARIVKENIE